MCGGSRRGSLLELRQRSNLDANARRLRCALDHLAGRRIAHERTGLARRDLVKIDLQDGGERKFPHTLWMHRAQEGVLDGRVEATAVFLGRSFCSAIRLMIPDLLKVSLTGPRQRALPSCASLPRASSS